MSIEAKYYPDPALGIFYEKNPDKDVLLREFLELVNEFGFKKRVICSPLTGLCWLEWRSWIRRSRP